MTYETENFLRALWRNAAWAYYWRVARDGRKESRWFPAQNPPPVPAAWVGSNVYMGVNTTTLRGPVHRRAVKQHDAEKPNAPPVSLVDALFCEWDAKEFDGDKAAILAHIERLRDDRGLPYPSVLVDSGGGYHGYWLLEHPLALNDDIVRAEAIQAQAAWVTLWGGDEAAKDIARVLRVPDTLNYKYDPPRPVTLHPESSTLRVYPWARLLEWRPEPMPAPALTPVEAGKVSGGKAVPAAWIERLIAGVRTAPVGKRNHAVNRAAYKLGRLVGGGALAEAGLVEALIQAGMQAGLPEKEARKEATGGMVDGKGNPRTWLQTMHRGAANGSARNGHSGDGNDDRERSAQRVVEPLPGFHCSDLGNAKRLVVLHGNDLRYCFPWASWLIWNGRRWQRDDTGEVFRRAKETASSIYLEAAKAEGDERRRELGKWAAHSHARERLAAMVDLARSERPLPVRPEEFDRDPWLLNVENGTIDLRTGTLRPHAREDLLSKIAPVAYDPAAQCPRWLAFLDHIMGGNQELIGYLQRVVGYALTGDVSEQVLFFLHGGGSNGKSTFLATLLAMLGRDYGTQAAPELLLAGSRHPTEVADLHGKRLVASIEVEDGQRMAEGLVKQMTGGDQLKARYMRENFFQFDPTFKLFLSANHKPVIRGTDYAIWRRIRLIPFTVKISDREKDPRLAEKLREELPGILAWAVRGCLAWQNEGLRTPAAVKGCDRSVS